MSKKPDPINYKAIRAVFKQHDMNPDEVIDNFTIHQNILFPYIANLVDNIQVDKKYHPDGPLLDTLQAISDAFVEVLMAVPEVIDYSIPNLIKRTPTPLLKRLLNDEEELTNSIIWPNLHANILEFNKCKEKAYNVRGILYLSSLIEATDMIVCGLLADETRQAVLANIDNKSILDKHLNIVFERISNLTDAEDYNLDPECKAKSGASVKDIVQRIYYGGDDTFDETVTNNHKESDCDVE